MKLNIRMSEFNVNTLIAPDEELPDLIKQSNELISIHQLDRQLCDIELLINGGFSPLDGFLNKKDYESVLTTARLTNGKLWPIPITLDVSDSILSKIDNKEKIALKDKEGFTIAIPRITDIWQPNLLKEAKLVYDTNHLSHPAVNYLLNVGFKNYIGGVVQGISLPNTMILRNTDILQKNYIQSLKRKIGIK